MSQKNIIDNLGRVKTYHYKNEGTKALNSLIIALRSLVKQGQVPTVLRGQVREATSYIGSDKNIQKHSKTPIAYSPGKEKELLANLEKIYETIEGVAGTETKEQAKERKLQLDKFYNLGLKLLNAGKISEADQSFHEALKYYRNEKKIYTMIAKALCNAKEFVRASDYLKKAYQISPDAEDVRELITLVKTNTGK